ncbi:MAG: FkbM family methyltransferase [Actinobacteria bacterium]|nr:FkbM family methyltransferase [Actinomycetota bacterium]
MTINISDYVQLGKKIINDLRQCNKRIILYGAAKNTTLLVNLLNDENVDITCFAVSDGMLSTDTFNNVPVYEISRCPYLPTESKVIVSTSDAHHKEISQLLLDKGYMDFDLFAGEYELALVLNYYDRLIKHYSIDDMRQMVKMGEIYIKNVRDINKRNIWAYVYEVGEIILPSQFNDYSMIIEGPYELSEVKLVKDDIVFDCGANLGLFSCLAASKGCKVYAFEPTKELVPELELLQKFYNGNIIPCEFALSDKSEMVRFCIAGGSDGANSFVLDNGSNYNFVSVKTISIDQFVEDNNIERIDFIKADIEGAERLMLAGAKQTLSRFAPKLSICTYHLPDDPQVLEDIIRDANPNYIIQHRWKKLFAFVPEEKRGNEIC